jgi:glycogen phosphorylase
MNKHKRVTLPIYTLLPTKVKGFDSLAELALDMRWSWDHAADKVWQQLDTELWEITPNPWVVLQTASRDRIECVLADPVFRKSVTNLVHARRQERETDAWFQLNHVQSPLTCAAYFTMKFKLNEALPIYSSGLSNVAGDQPKAASDLGVPVIGVGLLYQRGYFRQVIYKNGARQALYSYKAKHLFDACSLTLGYARRFATYKRPNRLLHDPERLLRLLSNPQRPVQLILAGKAHPAD